MILSAVIYIQDYIKLILLVTSILNYKYIKSWKPLAAGILFTVMYNIADHLAINSGGYIDMIQSWLYTLYHVTLIVLCSLSVEGKRKAFFSSAAYIVVCLLDDSMGMAASKLTKIPKTELETDLIKHTIMMTITLLIYFIVARLFHEINKKSKRTVYLKNNENLYAILLLCGFVSLGVATYTNAKIIAISVIPIFLLGLSVYNSLSKKYIEDTNHMNEKIMTSQKEYYEHLLNLESETRRFRHDINNHMLCVNALLSNNEYDAAKEYVQDICNKIGEMRKKISTGNNLVNAIVNDITVKYNKVELDWKGLVPEELTISNMDVCTIFSNLLDNAFCAASKCDPGKVDVTVKNVANSLMITIKNNISEPVRMNKRGFITSKLDKKNHGIGTMNVNDCVKLHEGKVDYDYTDSYFSVDVVLPNVIAS